MSALLWFLQSNCVVFLGHSTYRPLASTTSTRTRRNWLANTRDNRLAPTRSIDRSKATPSIRSHSLLALILLGRHDTNEARGICRPSAKAQPSGGAGRANRVGPKGALVVQLRRSSCIERAHAQLTLILPKVFGLSGARTARG